MATSKTLNKLAHYKILRPVCGQIKIGFCGDCQQKLYEDNSKTTVEDGRVQAIFTLCEKCSYRNYYENERNYWTHGAGAARLPNMKTRKEVLMNKDKPTKEEKEEFTKLEKEINWATYAMYIFKSLT
jgi:RNase P subunit RPR2